MIGFYNFLPSGNKWIRSNLLCELSCTEIFVFQYRCLIKWSSSFTLLTISHKYLSLQKRLFDGNKSYAGSLQKKNRSIVSRPYSCFHVSSEWEIVCKFSQTAKTDFFVEIFQYFSAYHCFQSNYLYMGVLLWLKIITHPPHNSNWLL